MGGLLPLYFIRSDNMSIVYNHTENMFYGTNAERLAATIGKYAPGDKFCETDTKNIYITNGSAWLPYKMVFQDLGLVVDATNMAAGATVYSNWYDGVDWIRNIIALSSSDQQYDIVIKRRDTALNESGMTLKSAQASSGSLATNTFSALLGYSVCFGIKNSSASPNTTAKLRIQMLGL